MSGDPAVITPPFPTHPHTLIWYMASLAGIFAYFFALVGIVLILAIGYYYYRGRAESTQAGTTWPPNSFMRHIGMHCPTGWTYQGQVNGMDVCKNEFNVSTAGGPADKCYDTSPGESAAVAGGVPGRGGSGELKPDDKNKIKTFSSIVGWPISKSAVAKTLADRCAFVKTCGPSSGKYATWFGIADLC